MRVTLLGTIGWMPSDRRETTCFACRAEDSLFIFDAGTGLRRLREPAQAALLDGARDIHLFLTHYHLDHVCGLAYLAGVLPGRALVIHAPAAELNGVDPEGALAGLLRRPYNPRDWEELTDLRVEPVVAGANEIAGHTVSVRAQQHSDVSVAYRLDDAFVLATDTRADPATAEFAAGVGLLLHEAWFNDADPRTTQMPAELLPGYAAHSEAGAVAGLAAAAGVGRLVPIHLNPLHDESYYAALEASARAVFPRTDVLPDGAVVDTDGVR
ncbi:MAG: MBL fold metallo-hydrolase [Actinobacteria bacterium]|nr:MBL fold metallo-hydrolase [Actinomycetota bacterium]